ncbi:MAG: diguanylate cyclase [Campylobacterales bacterium]|nr:diguanylate cyclase [Campylobacterales bacterium]
MGISETIAYTDAMKSLLASSDFLLNVLDTAHDAIYIGDDAFRFLYVNKAACDMLGYSRDELLTMGVLDIDPAMTLALLQQMAAVPHDDTYAPFETLHRTKSGALVPVEITRSILCFDDQTFRISIIRDIRERKAAEEKLHLLASVFTHAQEGIIITDADACIIAVNKAFCRISGYSCDEVLGKNPRLLKSGRQDASFYKAMWAELKQSELWSGELWNRRKNGDEYAEHLTVSVVTDTHGTSKHYIGLIADITKAKRYEQRLEKIAHYDTLTGVPNRFLLIDRLEQAMAQAQRHHEQIAVVYLDMDGFKEVNDRHGHAVGDRLLIEISQKLQQILRNEDTLARLGGDEFIIILRHLTHAEHTEEILQRILHSVSSTIHIDDYTITVSASLGVTFYPQQEPVDAEQLIRQSDQSMYVAKQSGKNRYYFFDPRYEH